MEGDTLSQLKTEVEASTAPYELKENIAIRLEQMRELRETSAFLPELDRTRQYVDWIVHLPWQERTEDILDLGHAQEILNRSHHGLQQLKDRILEYMAILQLGLQQGKKISEVRAPIMMFVGLVGTGKTTIASSIAEALGRKFIRIPFGGMGDPLDLRGKSRVHSEAEPGKIIKGLRGAGSRNPVILLDEIDRVTDEGRSSIMGVLVELLDPRQNHAFVDHYIDYPFDLSEALFIATGNNTRGIATAVLDRMEILAMPSYSDQEKITIGKEYLLPRALKEANMPEGAINIDDQLWPKIVRPYGFDGGIRTLERTIQAAVRKAAKEMVEGKASSFHFTEENYRQYLPEDQGL